jgi:hypothetical protein
VLGAYVFMGVGTKGPGSAARDCPTLNSEGTTSNPPKHRTVSPMVIPETEPFSDQFERWLKADTARTIGDLGEVFAEKSFAVTIVVLMLVPALPLPTGGITHVFEVIAFLLATEMVIGVRTLWLPKRWRMREIGGATRNRALPYMIRRIRWFERFSRPRLRRLFNRRWFLRLLGLIIAVFVLAAALAPPFSGLDTLPSMGAVGVALAIILEDAVLAGIGMVLGAAGIALILTLGLALFRVIHNLLW